ncbi:MAG: hypothetical protein K0S67_318, partial [Nitrososphaeraceae archaeon]|nr:hypothetical protein [Nitrososphaeraceae archaeon]
FKGKITPEAGLSGTLFNEVICELM